MTGEAHRCGQGVHQLAAGVPRASGQAGQVLRLPEVHHQARAGKEQTGALGNLCTDRVGSEDLQEGQSGRFIAYLVHTLVRV